MLKRTSPWRKGRGRRITPTPILTQIHIVDAVNCRLRKPGAQHQSRHLCYLCPDER